MYAEVQEARELILSTLADWTIEFPGNIIAMSLKVYNEEDVRLERGFNKLHKFYNFFNNRILLFLDFRLESFLKVPLKSAVHQLTFFESIPD